ncbi:Golgi reassembly stacking protein (GRASP homologue), putative [Bodo saltans]|uniref:Golgi reassembly stacking protein (GRASP homologue), putative n=1 Tax=Bodo saltans TaxID=75058 RepID=A0A0S4J5I2_BODSA|nr:Golgi reassembly stacking protein (GRASP homologue), putative [Bodo saltans]|eukprot:CUG82579.1 Golgi reassembly stacking protein (GRASP homologue), putative [Bodo saltans]
MGQGDSTLASIQGFQVARVLPGSPAHTAGLIPYFDIITAIDHLPLSGEASDFFKSYIKKSDGKTVALTVYNLRLRVYRDIPLTPSEQWGGAGQLGCSIDWTSAERCLSNTWHIVDVTSTSPAHQHPDILQQRDYIVGMQPADEQVITMLRDEADFGQRLDAWRQLRTTSPTATPPSLLFLIFDSVDNSIKEVLIEMGQHLSLGIDVANGYLHVIPPTPGASKLPSVKKFVVSNDIHEPHSFPEAPILPSTDAIPMAGTANNILQSPISPPSPHPTPVVSMTTAELPTAGNTLLPPPIHQKIAMPPPLHFPTFPPPPGN